MKTIKIEIQNILMSQMKDFIFNSTMVKAEFFWVKEFINKQRWHTKTFTKKF